MNLANSQVYNLLFSDRLVYFIQYLHRNKQRILSTLCLLILLKALQINNSVNGNFSAKSVTALGYLAPLLTLPLWGLSMRCWTWTAEKASFNGQKRDAQWKFSNHLRIHITSLVSVTNYVNTLAFCNLYLLQVFRNTIFSTKFIICYLFTYCKFYVKFIHNK